MAGVDLLIRGGRLLDPGAGIDEVGDIAILDGRIAALGGLASTAATEIVDATGLLVTPGLIDLHVHAYHDVNIYGFDVDPICLASGVTTAVDAGSAGSVNFPGFRRFIAGPSVTRLLAFVCVAQNGVTRGEMFDLSFADVEGAAAAVREHPEAGVGIKVRLAESCVGTDPAHTREVLALALRAGEESRSPVMVHIGETPITLDEIVDTLRPGDIVTHCYTPQRDGALGTDGSVRRALVTAKGRGVRFDVGHASGHLSFDVVRRCLDEGLSPDTISTDLHLRNFEGSLIGDLPRTMTKFLALGMSLAEVLRCTTSAVAATIGRSEELGRLAVGLVADLALLEVVEGPVALRDSTGASLRGDVRLVARGTVRAGKYHGAGARAEHN